MNSKRNYNHYQNINKLCFQHYLNLDFMKFKNIKRKIKLTTKNIVC